MAQRFGNKIGPPFHRQGPGGWIILDEPELYFRDDVLVDPLRQTLEVLVLERGRWLSLGTHEGSINVRADPFAAIELELGALWV